MPQTTITYLGQSLDVDYTYTPGEEATHDEPGCDHEADVHSVTIEGVDITDLIGPDQMERICEITANAHEDNSACERADYLIKQAKEVAA